MLPFFLYTIMKIVIPIESFFDFPIDIVHFLFILKYTSFIWQTLIHPY